MTEGSEKKPELPEEEKKQEHRPPQCERFPGCIFFNDKMARMPDTAEATKDQFCRSNYPTCVRYILQSIWKIKAPDDLYPYQLARGQAILDSKVLDQKQEIPTSEELDSANRTIRLMVNALGHGFLMFDKTGKCLPTYSKACETLLEIQPSGKHISDVLHLDAKQKDTMQTALRLIFNQTHAMSFDEVMHFAPKLYHHSSGSIIKLDYKPDRLASGLLDRVVVIATDITERIHEQERTEQRQALFESLERIFHERAFFGSYIRRLNEMLQILAGKGQRMSWEALRREIHTLKGDAGIFRLKALTEELHDLEAAVVSSATASPLSVPGSNDPCFSECAPLRLKIETEIASLSSYLKNLLGIDITKIEAERSFDKKVLYAFAKTLEKRGQPELRKEYIRTVCAESLKAYLQRYDTVLGDLALRFNKKVKPIRFASEDIPIVVDLYRDLLDSFVHLFRNAIDHGIESPATRKEQWKDEAAQVEIRMTLQPSSDGNQTLKLEIEDDGAGVDLPKIRQKLQKQYPSENWAARSGDEILQAILTQNVSSRDIVTQTSGRGIGMGAVWARVQERGGKMRLSTQAGQGTTITIEVPYLLDVPPQEE